MFVLTNFLTYLDKAVGCIGSGKNVDVVFLDCAKAFDKVPHRRFFVKLSTYGIGGKLISCISDAYISQDVYWWL